jgi:hypothetical protein
LRPPRPLSPRRERHGAVGLRRVEGGAEFKSVFEAECQARGLELFVLPPKRPDLNGCVERAQSTWRYEFYATYNLPHRIDKLQAFVDAFAKGSTTTGRMTPLPDKLRQSISKLSAKAIHRRIETGHPLV